MEREILFRGKTVDTNKWVYGFLYEFNGKVIIGSEDHSDDADTYYNDIVIPETIGQFTGLTDKNGTKIFEGDRVLVEYNYMGAIEVRYEKGYFNISKYDLNRSLIIGNIHDKI